MEILGKIINEEAGRNGKSYHYTFQTTENPRDYYFFNNFKVIHKPEKEYLLNLTKSANLRYCFFKSLKDASKIIKEREDKLSLLKLLGKEKSKILEPCRECHKNKRFISALISTHEKERNRWRNKDFLLSYLNQLKEKSYLEVVISINKQIIQATPKKQRGEARKLINTILNTKDYCCELEKLQGLLHNNKKI